MHRNTYLLLIFLAVLAAIVAGVNLTRKPEQATGNRQQATIAPTPIAPQPAIYELAGCGIAFPVPADHTALEGPGINVVFTSKTGDTIIVTCQKNIPRPALPADKIEKLSFEIPGDKPATIAAVLYHDTSEKLIFTSPVNGLDIFISGSGEAFQTLIRNLSIIKN